jgi:hypothetical protein
MSTKADQAHDLVVEPFEMVREGVMPRLVVTGGPNLVFERFQLLHGVSELIGSPVEELSLLPLATGLRRRLTRDLRLGFLLVRLDPGHEQYLSSYAGETAAPIAGGGRLQLRSFRTPRFAWRRN